MNKKYPVQHLGHHYGPAPTNAEMGLGTILVSRRAEPAPASGWFARLLASVRHCISEIIGGWY